MRTRAANFIALVVVCLGCIGASADVNARTTSPETTCHTISKAQVIALFDRWNRALLTKRTEAVALEYAANATLPPTVQNGPLTGREVIGKYFDYFLKKSPAATIDTRVIQTGCNLPTVSGYIPSWWMVMCQAAVNK